MVPLYPQIPPLALDKRVRIENADSFRLINITEALKYLEGEEAKYSRCKRRYNSAFNSVHSTTMAVGAVSASCSVGGIALFATGVGSVIGIALEGVGVFTGLTCFGLEALNKRFHKKHEALSTLAVSKLSSMKFIISKALEDNKIDDGEFKRVQDDLANYKQQKSEIQNKMHSQPVNVEVLKASFLEEGKKIGAKERMEKVQGLLSK